MLQSAHHTDTRPRVQADAAAMEGPVLVADRGVLVLTGQPAYLTSELQPREGRHFTK